MASSDLLPYTIITDQYVGASIENAVSSHFLEISAIRQVSAENGGSVLAVVTFPNDSGLGVACDGRKWERAEIRMDHDKLMALGSNKIRDMFKPRAQERFRRQLNMKTLPDGIKFVLDFTPPREGLELAGLTAALWLPKMVKLWFLAGQYLPDKYLATGVDHQQRPLADSAVGSIMALGHDDVCKKENCRLVDLSDWKINEKVCGIISDDGMTQSHIPAFRNVEDYCPIRHRVAIIRVLRTINGNGLLLNSAVRMWTVAQVAIYLEVPDVVVDYVMQWLVAAPNTKFVEICPEKAFQLAYALKIPSVLAAAFKILVNERAIDYAAKQPSPRLPRYTWAGRERDDYGDFPSDPIEYASRAFTERMNAKYQLLLTDDVFDHLPKILEWENFKYAGTLIREMVPCETQRVLQDAYDGLTQTLVSLFHTIVRKAVDKDIFEFDNVIHSQRKHYVKDRAQKLGAIYQGLCTEQKILTPFFWHALRSFSPYSEFAFSKHLDKQVQHYVLAYNLAVNKAINADLLPPSSEWPWSDREEQDKGASFLLSGFHSQLETSVRCFYNTVLDWRNDRSFPFFLSDHHLLMLEDNELKYLPIWADGLDDGSGGVFQDVIPSTDMGPSEPGPAYHTGWTAAGTDVNDDETVCYAVSTIGASELGIDGLDIDDATIARSISVQDTTTSSMVPADLNPRRVVALPSAPSTTASSDQFGFSDDGEFAQAKYALPADHQAQGAALASYVEDVSSSSTASSVAGDKIANANANANGPRLTDHETNIAVAFIGGILDGDDGDDDDDDGTSTLDGFDDSDSDMDIDDEN